jgi:negative regulator of sigma E activity
MSRLDVLASVLYRTIVDIAQYLETTASPEQWSLMDGGETLEICSELLGQCRQDENWQQLEQRYDAVGGCIYCPDSSDYDLALEVV